ncbi:oligoendopeptidase F [Candidatus Bathyarchaeota archaeon]|nr:oligoendopeptidase F [Candidatus Bathyarchaeota archaeon]
MTGSSSLPPRSQVPIEETWDLESVYASHEGWEAACEELTNILPKLSAYQGKIKEGPDKLLAYLELAQKAGIMAGKIRNYASNYYSVDTTNQRNAARLGQAQSLLSRLKAATAFFEPELMEIGLDVVEEWIESTPELAFFSHALDKLRRRQEHVRSSEVEEVLAMTSDPFSGPSTIYSSLNNADLSFEPAVSSKGNKIEVGQASIGGLITSPDRETRRTAWENYSDGYLAYKNTMASTLISKLKQDVFNMRARGYESSLHASMGPNNIPVEVYHNLIDVFKKNLPTWYRYWRLRREIMDVDTFHVYNIKAPLTTDKPYVSFKQAVDWICEGLAPLGEEIVDVTRKGCMEQRWVDRVRNKGKRQGAFTSATAETYPFIMMSWADDLFSLSTLAHELGHGLHSYYSWSTQPYIYGRYSLFEAEVASNFNQAMVRDYLFRTQTDRDFQIALIEEAMSNFHRYFFIMPTLARFELEAHTRVEDGKPLSADTLIELMAKLFKEGYGDEVYFDHDRIGITWAQFGHMYIDFYVYQYTTGISGAHALAKPILAGDKKAVERYHSFLKAGGSRYPTENLKQTGVDLTKPEPVESAFNYLAGLVDRLEELFN